MVKLECEPILFHGFLRNPQETKHEIPGTHTDIDPDFRTFTLEIELNQSEFLESVESLLLGVVGFRGRVLGLAFSGIIRPL